MYSVSNKIPEYTNFYISKKITSLPLFIRGKLGINKSILQTKFRRSHVCLHSQAGNKVPITGVYAMTVASCLASISMLIHFQNDSDMACCSLLFIIDFCTKTDAGDKVKYY